MLPIYVQGTNIIADTRTPTEEELLLSIGVHFGNRYKMVTSLCAIYLSSYRLHTHVCVRVMVARDLYCLRAGAVYV